MANISLDHGDRGDMMLTAMCVCVCVHACMQLCVCVCICLFCVMVGGCACMCVWGVVVGGEGCVYVYVLCDVWVGVRACVCGDCVCGGECFVMSGCACMYVYVCFCVCACQHAHAYSNAFCMSTNPLCAIPVQGGCDIRVVHPGVPWPSGGDPQQRSSEAVQPGNQLRGQDLQTGRHRHCQT